MLSTAPLLTGAVSRNEIINWLRLPESLCSQEKELAIFDMLSVSATAALEEFTRRIMVHREVTLRLKGITEKTILPWNPFVELVSFEVNGDAVDAADYELVSFTRPAYIKFKSGKTPDITSEDEYPVVIKYKAGESADVAGVPAEFKNYLLMLVATGYTKRQSIESSNLQPHSMKHYMLEIIRNKRVMRFN